MWVGYVGNGETFGEIKNDYMNQFFYNRLLEFSNLNNELIEEERSRLEGLDYQAVLRSPLNTVDDLIRIIHSVYGWMPTMLTSFNEINDIVNINFDRLLKLALEARHDPASLDFGLENELFEGLALLTNNRMVGASKVLMVLNPNQYPIFDSRVKNSWNKFWVTLSGEGNINFTKKIFSYPIGDEFRNLIETYANDNQQKKVYRLDTFSIIDQREKSVWAYQYYKSFLHFWKNNLNNIQIRDLEFLFFLTGKEDKNAKY